MRHCLLLTCVFGVATPCFGEVLRVPADFATIQGCINAAVDGDECVVSPGRYNEVILFHQWAVTVRSTDPTDDAVVAATIVDGTGFERSVVTSSTGEGSPSVLSGLTITGGMGAECGQGTGDRCGGGMYIRYKDLTVNYCVFIGNDAVLGGGIYAVESSPTFTNCTFQGNMASYRGGGIFHIGGKVTANNCTFTANRTNRYSRFRRGGEGGAVFSSGGQATFNECSFDHNAAWSGGGLFNKESDVRVRGCVFRANEADRFGGAMYNEATGLIVIDSTFRQNKSLGILSRWILGSGGAVYGVDGRSTSFEKCVFEGNSADFGGGIYSWRLSDVLFTNCSFMDNTANKQGGAIYNNSSAASVVTSKLERNSSRELGGGGLYQFGGSLNVFDSVFRKNETGGRGGGLYSLVLDSLTVSGTTLAENVAGEDGGGMFSIRAGEADVTDCKFSGNAARVGAGMYNEYSDPRVKRTVFSDNKADWSGGGMFNIYANPELTDCRFTNNTAGGAGGGVCNSNQSSPTLTDCEFIGNSAEDGGGVYSGEDNSLFFSACLFDGNSASNHGGGINSLVAKSLSVTDCIFNRNTAGSRGGGLLLWIGRNVTVRDSAFNGNLAGFGGGIFDYRCEGKTITNCRFSENSAENKGGGVGSHRSWYSKVTNCEFDGNSAGDAGAGLYVSDSVDTTVASCTFTKNSATSGGGMFHWYSHPPIVTNCTFVNNVGSNGAAMAFDTYWGGVYGARLTNCIVRGESNSLWRDDEASVTAANNNLQGGVPDGVIDGGGNLDVDPLFARWPDDGGDGWGDDPETSDVDESLNDDFGDLRLRASSPLIDAGDNSGVPDWVVVDLLGNDRFVDDPFTVDTGVGDGAIVDMGAYEYEPDCNVNGVGDDVDVLDGSSLDCNENGYPDECDADLDGDGVPDECDECAGSDVRETVVIGDCDTGVFNLSVGEGCLMSDAVVACFEDAWIPRSFVSCVSEVARGWKHDGLINRREFGGIVSCAGRRRGIMNREE